MTRTTRLYFLRHGLAGPGHDDDLRPLTAEGRRRLARTARLLEALDPPCGLILTSPLLRAVQTAEIMAPELGLDDRVTVEKRLRCGCGMTGLAAILADHTPACRDLMLVGHEPDLSLLIDALTGGRVIMQPGTLALVDLPDSGRGRLLWLLQPDVVAGLAPAP